MTAIWLRMIQVNLVCPPLAAFYLADNLSNNVGLFISASSQTPATTMMQASAKLHYTMGRAQRIELSNTLFSYE